ncbi:MAG: DUF5011 domain-containing protein [Lachnospiraceae bacterium]|nr:DUF5011 domain-containing protein [Lachnospiraceae bacterium]
MKKFLSERRKTVTVVVALLVLVLAVAGGYQLWHSVQPKFQDVTIELGTDSVTLSEFMTQYADASLVSFVTDPASINIDETGDVSVNLAYRIKEDHVTLNLVVTTAPTAEFLEVYEAPLNYEPDAEDFVSSVEDYSETTVSFAETTGSVRSGEDYDVTVVVTDASGNSVSQDCTISYVWMKEAYELEYGDHLTKQDLLVNTNLGTSLIEQSDVNEINESEVGEYVISSSNGYKTVECTVTVADTTAPEVELQDVSVYPRTEVELDDFVVSATDLSGDLELSMTSEADTSEVGSYTVTIEAEDIYGNVASVDATLIVKTDDVPPVFSGLSTISLTKNSSAPDYLSGVTAVDAIDGDCNVSYDASSVNYSSAGTYYVTYTASDTSGNVASAKRKVTISYDSADTDALVTSIAAGLGSDAKGIAEYVRSDVSDNPDGGGSNPGWYGMVFPTK